MNIQGETPKLSLKLKNFERRYHVDLAAPPLSTVHRLIVLGDGTPDDYAVFLVSHRLDGSDNCSIIKPTEGTGTSTFERIRIYLSEYQSLRVLLFIVDQEKRKAKSISKEFERQVKKSNLSFTCRKEAEAEDGRLKVYDCALSDKQFSLILVLNGLPEMPTNKHTIEDHFLKAASELGLVKLPQKITDPKNYWQSKVDITTKEIVLKELIAGRRLTEEAFPQQLKACEYLKATGK